MTAVALTGPYNLTPPEWTASAACLRYDPRLWDEVSGKPSAETRRRLEKAVAICRTCPVETTCAAKAVEEPAPTVARGVWAAMYFKDGKPTSIEAVTAVTRGGQPEIAPRRSRVTYSADEHVKQCSKCQITREVHCFYKIKRGNGRSSWCVYCSRESGRERRAAS